MFEQALIASPAGSRRAWSTLMGFTTQSVLLTAAVLVPLVYPDALPRMQSFVTVFTPGAPAPPPPKPVRMESAVNAAPVSQFRDSILVAPATVPPLARILEDPPMVASGLSGAGSEGGVVGGIPGTGGGGLPASIAHNIAAPAPPPPVSQPAAVERKAVPDRIKVGGLVQEAMIIHRVIPAYPQLAKQARVSGVVQLVSVIGTDGRIRELQVTSGHPLLIKAAVDAVRQWIYRPTLLNGDPVEIIAPITVTFTLN